MLSTEGKKGVGMMRKAGWSVLILGWVRRSEQHVRLGRDGEVSFSWKRSLPGYGCRDPLGAINADWGSLRYWI